MSESVFPYNRGTSRAALNECWTTALPIEGERRLVWPLGEDQGHQGSSSQVDVTLRLDYTFEGPDEEESFLVFLRSCLMWVALHDFVFGLVVTDVCRFTVSLLLFSFPAQEFSC